MPAFWFQKGVSPSAGIPAKIETNVDSIFKFAREHMTPVDDSNEVSDAPNEEGGASNDVSGASNDLSDASNSEGDATNAESTTPNELGNATPSPNDNTEKEKEQPTNRKPNEDDETTVDNAEL